MLSVYKDVLVSSGRHTKLTKHIHLAEMRNDLLACEEDSPKRSVSMLPTPVMMKTDGKNVLVSYLLLRFPKR